jgi:mono/diheme cytochrome c family protein
MLGGSADHQTPEVAMSVFRMGLVVVVGLTIGHGVASAQHEAGVKAYSAQKCSICHSIAGAGNKKLPLDGVGTKLTADQIREWIVDPASAAKKANSTTKPAMKAYTALPKPDLDALVGYLASLKK